MRHVYVNRATYLLATLLVLSALIFAWVRSSDVVIASAREREESAAVEEAFAWREQGADIFRSDCSGCHERLTHLPDLYAADGGRSYLATFLLFGYEGETFVPGERGDLRHPSFERLSDEEAAAVLNHMLVSWGNEDDLPADAELYRPADLERIRAEEREPEEVAAARPLP